MSDNHLTNPYERMGKDEVRTMMNERRLVKMVRDFMQRSRDYREPHLELARQSRDLYENWQTKSRSLTHRANLNLPFGYTIIETQVPQLMDLFYQGGSVVTFRGRDYTDAEWENPITDFHQHQLAEMNIQSNSASYKKSMLLDGTAIAKIPYRFREIDTVKRVNSVDPVTGAPRQEKVKVKEVIKDGPDFELVPIYDFFPDWSVKKPGAIQEMRGVVHRMYKTFNELEKQTIVTSDGAKPRYKNLDKLKMSTNSKGCKAWAPPFYHDDRFKHEFERLQDNRQFGIKDKGQIEIWEYWGLWDPKGDGNFEEYILVIANGDVVIREEKNFYDAKFKPFVATPNILREQEFYGIPELASVRSLIKEANTLRNARLDNVNLSVNPMWIADRSADINERSLFSRPGGIVWTNDVNALRPLDIRDPSIGSRNELVDIQQDIQNATALVQAAPAAASLGKQFGRSATGVNFIQSISSSRIGLKARILSDTFYKPMAWIMLMTNRQFVTEDKWVRVSDPNTENPFTQLPADAFFRQFDFDVETSLDTGGPEGKFQRLQSVSQVIQAMEASQPGAFRMDVLAEALLRPLLGRHVKRFTRSDDERQQLQDQQLASQQAINATVGQGAPQPNSTDSGLEVSPAVDVLAGLGLQ